MNSRKIDAEEEDNLQIEVDLALKQSMEERFRNYCNTIASLHAMANIDVLTYPSKRVIKYLDE